MRIMVTTDFDEIYDNIEADDFFFEMGCDDVLEENIYKLERMKIGDSILYYSEENDIEYCITKLEDDSLYD